MHTVRTGLQMCAKYVQGLMPLFVNPKTGRWTNRKVSFGALGDSYYEYLIKLWVLKGRQPQDEWVREMWEQVSRLVWIAWDAVPG